MEKESGLIDELVNEFVSFIRSIWKSPERRRAIVGWWHTRKPNSENNTEMIFSTFVYDVLTSKMCFWIDTEKIWFFEDQNLCIPLQWFKEKERNFLCRIVAAHKILFNQLVKHPSKSFSIKKSKILEAVVLKEIDRLLIIREFALSILEKSSTNSELFEYLLIGVQGLMLGAYKDKLFKPEVLWTKNLLAFSKAIRAPDPKKALKEIEIMASSIIKSK